MLYNNEKIKQAYISKYNNERDNKVNLLMVTDGNTNWYYLEIKNTPRLLRGITSNHNGGFYCLNYFHSYRTSRKLKKYERICKDHDFCDIKITDEDNKILEYNPGEQY